MSSITDIPRTAGQTHEVVLISLMLAVGVLLLFAAEGPSSLALALPLAIPVGIVGGIFGRAIALRSAEPAGRTGLAPSSPRCWCWSSHTFAPAVYEVVTVVEVTAPWTWCGVASSRSPICRRPTEWVFRIGVAARCAPGSSGPGVGATR